MTPECMAEIHAACFTMPRPWTVMEISGLCEQPNVFAVFCAQGFAIGRIAGPEAELLTIAVHPKAQRQGYARQLLGQFFESLRPFAVNDVFLEVAEDNRPARKLYESAGFANVGRRPAYYQAQNGENVTAIVMKLSLA